MEEKTMEEKMIQETNAAEDSTAEPMTYEQMYANLEKSMRKTRIVGYVTSGLVAVLILLLVVGGVLVYPALNYVKTSAPALTSEAIPALQQINALDLKAIATNLEEISSAVSSVDWNEVSGQLTSLDVEALNSTLGGLDIEELEKAIENMNAMSEKISAMSDKLSFLSLFN